MDAIHFFVCFSDLKVLRLNGGTPTDNGNVFVELATSARWNDVELLFVKVSLIFSNGDRREDSGSDNAASGSFRIFLTV